MSVPVGEKPRSVVDSEARLSEALVNSISPSTCSHSDRLNAAVRWRGHMLQLLSDSFSGTHFAGITAWVLWCSATGASVISLAVRTVSVNDSGTCRLLLLIGTAISDVLVAMAVPRSGRYVNGKHNEYLGCTNKVFVDAINIESNISCNTQFTRIINVNDRYNNKSSK